MKIHLDPDKKQVSVEGDIKLCDLFNRLMSWFPEEWEKLDNGSTHSYYQLQRSLS